MNTPKLRLVLSFLCPVALQPLLWAAETVAQPSPAEVALPSSFQWLVLSPIPIQEKSGAGAPSEDVQNLAFAADLLAASGGETQLKAQAGKKLTVNGVTREWISVAPTDAVVSLNAADRNDDYSVAYAVTEFDVPAETRAWLGVGSDDDIRVWLNGALVHEHWIARPTQPDDDVVRVSLKAGRNHLLLKIQNGTGPWGFACRLMDAKTRAERLVTAVKAGDLPLLKTLVGEGFDVNGRTREGLTPYLAARV